MIIGQMVLVVSSFMPVTVRSTERVQTWTMVLDIDLGTHRQGFRIQDAFSVSPV